MSSINLIQSRYDFFLIWGHGLEYRKEIIKLIASENNFEIQMILNHEVRNIKRFVKKVYEHDYVPYFHLRGKTKYLMTTPKEVMFIFIKNKNPQETWKLGHGSGHIESDIIVKYKNIIRDKFNERKDDRRTENHVIHASDNKIQVHYLLKYLGYHEGIRLFDRHMDKSFKVPYFIRSFLKYQIRELDIENIVCNNIIDDKIETIDIETSFQHRFLLGFKEEYREYINKYQGTILKAYYDLEKYEELASNFEYLTKGYETDYIIVEKVNDGKYLVLDGLHRISLCKKNGYKKIVVAEIL